MRPDCTISATENTNVITAADVVVTPGWLRTVVLRSYGDSQTADFRHPVARRQYRYFPVRADVTQTTNDKQVAACGYSASHRCPESA